MGLRRGTNDAPPGEPPKLRGYALNLDKLLNSANRDTDPVTMVELIDETRLPTHPNEEPGDGKRGAIEGAIVILRGADTVALFEQWAIRNRVLTRQPIPAALPPGMVEVPMANGPSLVMPEAEREHFMEAARGNTRILAERERQKDSQ